MLNPKSLLKVLPIVLLSFGPIVGMGGVERSQPTPSQPKAIAPPRTLEEFERDRQAELKKIPGLVQKLKTGTEAEKRSAVSALVDIGQDALPDLIPLFKDPNPGTQAIVAEIVDQIELSTKLREALNPSPTPPGRFKLLQMYGEKPAFSVDEAIRIIERTAQATSKEYRAARASSVILVPMSPEEYQPERSLELIGDSAAPKLIPLLQSDNIAVRSRFAGILVQIQPQSPEAIASLSRLLQSPDANVRKHAAEVLGKIGKAAKPQLAELLKNPNPKVRAAAAAAIVHLPGTPKSLLPELIPLLQDPNLSVRIYAVLALSNMGEFGKPAIPTLTALLKDKSEPVRLISSQILRQLQPEKTSGKSAEDPFPLTMPMPTMMSLPPVKATDNQQQPPVKISVPDAVQALLDAENYDDEYQAIQQLQAIGQPAVSALIPLSKNEYQTIRQLAARAIGSIGTVALPELLPLLNSNDQADRRLAVLALRDMQQAALLPQFVALLNDPNEEIRSISRRAIGNLPFDTDRSDLVSALIPLLNPDISQISRA